MRRKPTESRRRARAKHQARGADWQFVSPDDVLTIVDQLNDAVIVVGPDWRFRYINDPAVAVLERGREELLGRHVWTEYPFLVDTPIYRTCETAMRERRTLHLVDEHIRGGQWIESHVFPRGRNLVVVFRDVSERVHAEAERKEFVERMSEAEQIASFGVWRWELPTGRVLWSDQLHRIYGLEPGTFGGTVDDFVASLHPEDREKVWRQIDHAVKTGEPFVFHERVIRSDGRERVLLSQGRPIAGPDGSTVALVGLCQDVTDRLATEQALGHSERRMRAILDNSPSVMLVRDLDGNYLMANGEMARVLDRTPEELTGEIREELWPDFSDRIRAAELRAAGEMEPVLDEFTVVLDGRQMTFLTVTFALTDEEGKPVETCTIATDVSDRGEREAERRDRAFWTKRIKAAIHEDRMVVYGQPVINLSTGRTDASELLVRMTAAETGNLMAPASFLPAAERFGLVQLIDVWMVKQALALPAEFSPEVNLSAVSLCDPSVRHEIMSMLKAAPEAGKRIVFEITESAAAEHLDAAIEFAVELAALGCGFALDDFGTGFASFTYLRRLPLRYLKIDASFVRELVSDRDDRRVVQSIIGIASQFGLRTIAEGVEDEATLIMLRELGADYAQGYYIGVPAPITRESQLLVPGAEPKFGPDGLAPDAPISLATTRTRRRQAAQRRR